MKVVEVVLGVMFLIVVGIEFNFLVDEYEHVMQWVRSEEEGPQWYVVITSTVKKWWIYEALLVVMISLGRSPVISALLIFLLVSHIGGLISQSYVLFFSIIFGLLYIGVRFGVK